MQSASEIWHAFALSFKRTPGLAIISLIAILASAVGLLLIAFGQRSLLNAASDQHGEAVIVASLVAATGFAVHGSISRIAGNLQFYLGSEVSQDLMIEMFRLVNGRRDFEKLFESAYSDKLERLHYGTFWLGALGWVLIGVVMQIVAFAASFLALLVIHPLLPLLIIAAFVPVWLSIRGRKHIRAVEDELLTLKRQERIIHDMCTVAENIKETRISGVVTELDRISTSHRQIQNERQLAAGMRAGIFECLSWLIFGGVFVSGVVLASESIADGKQSIGSIILIIALAAGLRNLIESSIAEMTTASEGFAAAEALAGIRLHATPRPVTPAYIKPDYIKNGISLRNVSFTYKGSNRPALRDVSLKIPPGAVVAIVGPNGAGKSTLVDILIGVLRPSQGTATLDGIDISEFSIAAVNGPISGTFQNFMKTPFSLRENVGLGHPPFMDSTERITSALSKAGADSIFESLPNGIDTLLFSGQTTEAADLSHGQWQRVAIARGYLYPNPLIFAMDEPSSALDPSTEHELFSSATSDARRRGREVGGISILVSHRFSSALLADMIIVVDQATVAAVGSHEELVTTSTLYRKMLTNRQHAYDQ